MPFKENTIYFVANDKLRREIEKDPVLSFNFYWIKPGTIQNAVLPPDGLFAVRHVTNPEWNENPRIIPWDAIWSKKPSGMKFYPERNRWDHPPHQMLERIHELVTSCNSKAFYYIASTHGGDFMKEYAWIFTEERITILNEDDERRETYINGKEAVLPGDVLFLALTAIGVREVPDSGWFEPHTGEFDWDEIRLMSEKAGRKADPHPFPTSIYHSAALGDYESVRKCIEAGFSPSDYDLILGEASASGNVKTVELLLDHGAKIQNGWKGALSNARNRETVELLVKHGADVNHESNPLAFVAESGNEDAVKCMIGHGAVIALEKDNELWFSACKGGIFFLLETLFPKVDPACTELFDHNGLTAAAAHNRLDAVKWLYEKGVPLQVNALIEASEEGHLETVKWLLENTSVDINGKDRYDYFPLYKTTYHDQLEVAELLLEKGADPHQLHGNYQFSILHGAAFHGSIAMMERFIEAGVPIDSMSTDNRTPLWIAIDWKNQEKTNYLIQKGASLDITNPYGETLQELAKRKKIVLGE